MTTMRGLGLVTGILLAHVVAAAAPAPAAEPNWPATLVIGTASPGGTYQVYGRGLARILTRELRLPVAARSTGGPAENIQLLENGEIQIAFVTMGVALQAWNGTEPWTQGREYRAMRAIFPMYDTPFHFIARSDSGITGLREINGREIGVGPEGGTAAAYVPRLLTTLGLAASPVHGSWEMLAGRLQAQELDVMAVAAGVPFPAVAGLEAHKQIRHLPLAAEQILALRVAMPELTPSRIPPGAYPSLQKSYDTVGLYNFAVAHRDLPADLVYRLVKATFDQHDELVEIHPAAAATVPANFIHNTFLPYHDGAIRYYGNTAATGVLFAD